MVFSSKYAQVERNRDNELPGVGSPKSAGTVDGHNQGHGLSPLPQGKTTTPNYSLNHARSGSDTYTASTSSTVHSTSPLRARAILTLYDFHEISRAAGPIGVGYREGSVRPFKRRCHLQTSAGWQRYGCCESPIACWVPAGCGWAGVFVLGLWRRVLNARKFSPAFGYSARRSCQARRAA